MGTRLVTCSKSKLDIKSHEKNTTFVNFIYKIKLVTRDCIQALVKGEFNLECLGTFNIFWHCNHHCLEPGSKAIKDHVNTFFLIVIVKMV